MPTNSTLQTFPLPDLDEAPAIGSPEREAHEDAALGRAAELLHEREGRIREALYDLEIELRGDAPRQSQNAYGGVRKYARLLVRHVEQCWATAVLR